MMHLKNISVGNPKTLAQFQLTKRSGVIWLYSEDGKNWYEQQKNFAADTLKIAYDKNGVIVNISKDVSTINPSGLSVVELPNITANYQPDLISMATGNIRTALLSLFPLIIRQKPKPPDRNYWMPQTAPLLTGEPNWRWMKSVMTIRPA